MRTPNSSQLDPNAIQEAVEKALEKSCSEILEKFSGKIEELNYLVQQFEQPNKLLPLNNQPTARFSNIDMDPQAQKLTSGFQAESFKKILEVSGEFKTNPLKKTNQPFTPQYPDAQNNNNNNHYAQAIADGAASLNSEECYQYSSILAAPKKSDTQQEKNIQSEFPLKIEYSNCY